MHRELPLEELLNGITFGALGGNIGTTESIQMVTSDSREVMPGSLFVAVRGYCADGHRFIDSAIERGAIAVICEELPADISVTCLYIIVSDARKALAEAAHILWKGF